MTRIDKVAQRTACKAKKEAQRKAELDAYIQKIVDAAPPLTMEQRDKIAALLRPVVDTNEAPPRRKGDGSGLRRRGS